MGEPAWLAAAGPFGVGRRGSGKRARPKGGARRDPRSKGLLGCVNRAGIASTPPSHEGECRGRRRLDGGQRGAAEAAIELAGHGHQGLDGAGDEGGLLFRDRVVDGDAEAFVEDFDAEDLGGLGLALFVVGHQGDVEGQDLVGVPGGIALAPTGGGSMMVVRAALCG